MKKILLICSFCFYLTSAYTQEIPLVKNKKVNIKGGYALVKKDTVIYALRDTAVFIPINQDYYLRKGHSSEDVYQHLRQKAGKNRITREIANGVIRKIPQNTVQTNAPKNTIIDENKFVAYQNLIIRNISYKRLDPFGTSLYDTTVFAKRWYEKAGNKTHFNTAHFIIRKSILFKSGDVLDPLIMADNERVLRDLPHIQDARIYISNISPNKDSADVTIVLKDVFSLGVGLEIGDYDEGNLRLWDNNFLGLGTTFDSKIFWDLEQQTVLGYHGIYKFNNLGGKFINGLLQYTDKYGTQSYRASLARGFYTPNIKYAGGIYAEDISTRIYYTAEDSLTSELKYRDALAWIGRSFPIKSSSSMPVRHSLIVTAGINYYDYIIRPPTVDVQKQYSFHDRIIYLGSLSFSRQGFYKSSLIYSFGRTEDIPFGHLINFTAGYEKSEFSNRLYTSFLVSKGWFAGKAGYLYAAANAGTFWKQSKTEQAVTRFTMNYFTNLGEIGRYSVRNFINLNYVRGYNMFSDESLTINKSMGIRGFKNDTLTGISKVVLSLESNFFTPWYIAGFRFAMFGFTDIGMISVSNEFWNYDDYYGIGLGFRIKNERLVLPAFQIRFAFYPNISEANQRYVPLLINEPRYTPNNFYASQPSIIRIQ